MMQHRRRYIEERDFEKVQTFVFAAITRYYEVVPLLPYDNKFDNKFDNNFDV